MRAYPYDVDVVISNGNKRSSKIVTCRVHAYNAIDAMAQATIEVAAAADSADLKVTRVAPPAEACAPIEELLAGGSR